MTTTTETPVSCPPSAVHDQIVPWFEVYEGDLVVYDGQFHRLERMWPLCSDRLGAEWVGIYLLREGVRFRTSVNSNDLTAVRRYDVDGG